MIEGQIIVRADRFGLPRATVERFTPHHPRHNFELLMSIERGTVKDAVEDGREYAAMITILEGLKVPYDTVLQTARAVVLL